MIAGKDEKRLPSLAEARRFLAVEEQKKLEACKQEVEAVLLKHRCKMDVSVTLRLNQVIPRIAIVPIEEEEE